ncbi:MAG: Gfo/Idh/MocA family oxidoreductase [Clostridiales bacterium]|nr:Gfo/Idh/MocA family oxidoreductase [Clostridiales bacterium]
MKKSTVLIGGGVIATHYVKGFENSRTLRLDALVDTNPSCAARELFSVPFFTDLKEALKLNPEVAILALPVPAHGRVARELIDCGVDVITEKPMFGSLKEVYDNIAYAEKRNRHLACMYHWKEADEVRFLKSNLKDFGKIKSVFVHIRDDYAANDGIIRDDRLGLGGAWIDSGINALSYIDEIIDLSESRVTSEELIPDRKHNLPAYAKKIIKAFDTEVTVVVDWRYADGKKTSEIECEAGKVFVDHTAQRVSLNGKEIFVSTVSDRLSSHYENLFYTLSPDDESLKKSTLILHDLLYAGSTR